jgi:hypothetical protein
MSETCSELNDEIHEFIEYYGMKNIPNPDHYPRRFEFLMKSFRHYKRMQDIKNEN